MTDLAKLLPLGSTALDVVCVLAEKHALQSLTLIRYAPIAGLEERLASTKSENSNEVFQLAERLRDLAGRALPYWDSILIASRARGLSRQFLTETVRHGGDEATRRFTFRETDVRVRLQELIDQLPEAEVLGICSACQLANAQNVHIPMLDFRCVVEDTNVEDLRYLLGELGESDGVLLSSGRSFHYYGFRLLSYEAWMNFTARSLLAAPIVDARYVAHRLLEGTATLRLTATTTKPAVPKVVAWL